MFSHSRLRGRPSCDVSRARCLAGAVLALFALCSGSMAAAVGNLTLVVSDAARMDGELGSGHIHSWRLLKTNTCRGALVVELWEDAATAATATPLLQGTLLCPVLTTKALSDMPSDPMLEAAYRTWQATAHSPAPQWSGGGAALARPDLRWDVGACARQLPYHWIVADVLPAAAAMRTWWLHVVNHRRTAVPNYHVRASCSPPTAPHCPQPNLAGAPCSGRGTCVPLTLSNVISSQCKCLPGYTGIGCEAEVPTLMPESPTQLTGHYNPDLKLVANSSLNNGWSLFQLQVPQQAGQVVLELEANWASVASGEQVASLARPRLCYGSAEAAELAHNRPEPAYMYCQKPLRFPLEFRTGVSLSSVSVPSLERLLPPSRTLLVVVMNSGQGTATLTAHYLKPSDPACPFDCSQHPEFCLDEGTCRCGMPWQHGLVCQYTDLTAHPASRKAMMLPSQGSVQLGPLQHTLVLLSSSWYISTKLISTGSCWSKLEWEAPNGESELDQLVVKAYWVYGPLVGGASGGGGTHTMFGLRKTADSPGPNVLCVTKDGPPDSFTPPCQVGSFRQGGALDLVLLLTNTDPQRPVSFSVARKDARGNDLQQDSGIKHHHLAAALVPVPILLLAASVVLAVMVRQGHFRWLQEGGSRRQGVLDPIAEAQAAVAAAAGRPTNEHKGVPQVVIDGFPILVFGAKKSLATTTTTATEAAAAAAAADPAGHPRVELQMVAVHTAAASDGSSPTPGGGARASASQQDASSSSQQAQQPAPPEEHQVVSDTNLQRSGQPDTAASSSTAASPTRDAAPAPGTSGGTRRASSPEAAGTDGTTQEGMRAAGTSSPAPCQHAAALSSPSAAAAAAVASSARPVTLAAAEPLAGNSAAASTSGVVPDVSTSAEGGPVAPSPEPPGQPAPGEGRAPAAAAVAGGVHSAPNRGHSRSGSALSDGGEGSRLGGMMRRVGHVISGGRVPREAPRPPPPPQPPAPDTMCAICLCDYESGDLLRGLPCEHVFHQDCIDAWMRGNHTCPCCRLNLLPPAETQDSGNNSSSS